MAQDLFRLEVKIPDGQGGYTTQVVQLDYTENIAGKPLVFCTEAQLPAEGNSIYLYIVTDKSKIVYYDANSKSYKSVATATDTWKPCNTTQEGYIAATAANTMLVTKNGDTAPSWSTFTIDGGSASNTTFSITN